MILFNQELLINYAKQDEILKLLIETMHDNDGSFTTHRWLFDSFPKRMIYFYMYGDLLRPAKTPKRILDVGGGFCSLSRILLNNHDYTLLDIMAHDNITTCRSIEDTIGRRFLVDSNWDTFTTDAPYDYIIANDLFPNVDQRLEAFIDLFLPWCDEMRLSLTYYNTPKYYVVKRVNADEIFHIQVWDGVQVERVLEKYKDVIDNHHPELLSKNPPSLFKNNRQVCLVSLHGKQKQ